MRYSRIISLLAFLTFAIPCWAATYYVDYSAGADTNAGTSMGAPFKHAPGMIGCTSNCSTAASALAPGDSVILKGGVSWPSTVFPWTLPAGGSSGNPIYYGVSMSYYTGASWARPIFNLGNTCLSSPNNIIEFGVSYITFDNVEFTGFNPCLSGSGQDYSNGYNCVFHSNAANNWTAENNYVHAWLNSTMSADFGGVFCNDAGLDSQPNAIMLNNYIDGSDTVVVEADPNCTAACQGTMIAFWYGQIVRGNLCQYTSNCYVGAAQEFSGNYFQYTRYTTGTVHENCFENNSDPSEGLLFFNNVCIHTRPGVNIWMAPESTATHPSYAFNNYTADTTAGNVWDLAAALSNPGGTEIMFNNTLECGTDGSATQICVGCSDGMSPFTMGSAYTACTIQNNQLITSNANPYYCRANCTNHTNLVQTQTAANAQGYTLANGFMPTTGGSTIGAGTSASTFCTAIGAILTSAGTACNNAICISLINATNHTVGPCSSASSRPGTPDIGSYQFSAGTQAATPIISPCSGSPPNCGTYLSPQTISMTCSSPSPTLYYTTNGSTPTTGSTLYAGSFSQSIPVTVKAICTSSGLSTSNVATNTYSLPTGPGGSTVPGGTVTGTSVTQAPEPPANLKATVSPSPNNSNKYMEGSGVDVGSLQMPGLSSLYSNSPVSFPLAVESRQPLKQPGVSHVWSQTSPVTTTTYHATMSPKALVEKANESRLFGELPTFSPSVKSKDKGSTVPEKLSGNALARVSVPEMQQVAGSPETVSKALPW